jgi:hypothetical protein
MSEQKWILGGFFRKSFLSRQSREINAFENQRQTGACDFDGLGLRSACWKAKGADFEAFVPDRETISIPVQNLHESVLTIEKNKQMIAKRIGFENIANDGEQSVEGLSHIDGRGAE